MNKSKALRIGGFTLAVGVTASLVGFAAHGTGAYFTDSHTGTINTSTGDVKVNTSSLTLNYTGLLPGASGYKSQTVDYTAAGTGPEDIWLVLPTDGSADALGVPASSAGLGRYGHFAVDAPAGSFVSNNLNGPTPGDPGSTCSVDADGHGGSNAVAHLLSQDGTGSSNISPLPYCAPSDAILLSRNLTYGQGGTATITFGFTQILRGGQDAGLSQLANFKIVATQAGVRPDDPNNPVGTISSH